MTNPNFTYIAFLLDETGSMVDKMPEPILGFNRFLAEQRALPGKCFLHLVLFDSAHYRYNAGDISTFPDLTPQTYIPGAMTPLWDAACRLVDETGLGLEAMPEAERPAHVIFIVLTDGKENASENFKLADWQERRKRQEEHYGWTFLYLGVSDEKWEQEAQAASMGIQGQNASYTPGNQQGTAEAYALVSARVTSARTGGQS